MTFRRILRKTIVFHLIFLVLHFAHDWLPYTWVTVVGARGESVMQHMKVAFFAWTLAALGELALRRTQRRRIFDANLLASLLAPWAMFLWYLASALYGGQLPSTALEIVYANVILFLAGLGLSLLAYDLEGHLFARATRLVMIIFYGCLVYLLVTFTFETPWGGFFVHP